MAGPGRRLPRRGLLGAAVGAAVPLSLAGAVAGSRTPAVAVAVAVAVRIEARAEGRPISPLIYGVAHAGPAALAATGARLHRWGGNPNSRYNWEHGSAWNAARDWEFRNYGEDAPGTAGEHAAGPWGPSGTADRYVALNRSLGVETYLTVPALGWVAKDASNASRSTGVPPAGATGGYDPGPNRAATSLRSLARKGGPFADPPDRADGAVYQDEWIAHLVRRFGPAAAGGVRYYVVDNEPDLWAETHTDVHPERPGYDALLAVFLEYARAIKDVDPSALVAGPALSGWSALHCSPRDRDASQGVPARVARRLLPDRLAGLALPDRRAHGGEPFLPWWLEQVRRHDQLAGRRTLDVLDVHFYPQAPGVYSDADDPATEARRLRSTRALWDGRYVDESWIAQPVRLIPRLREWIARHYPGTRLAIGEWNWGAGGTMNGALAVADVLGIFGREGVDLAAYWTTPAPGTPAALAFALYANYDGRGGAFGDRSLPVSFVGAVTPDDCSVYASRDSATGDLVAVAINKGAGGALPVRLRLAGLPAPPAPEVRRFCLSRAEPAAIADLGEATLEGDEVEISLPAQSATVLHFRHRQG